MKAPFCRHQTCVFNTCLHLAETWFWFISGVEYFKESYHPIRNRGSFKVLWKLENNKFKKRAINAPIVVSLIEWALYFPAKSYHNRIIKIISKICFSKQTYYHPTRKHIAIQHEKTFYPTRKYVIQQENVLSNAKNVLSNTKTCYKTRDPVIQQKNVKTCSV